MSNKVRRQLQTIDPSLFSSRAVSRLKENIDDFTSDLVSESIKVSKRYRSDTVSAAHVEKACDYLVANTSRRLFRHLGTVGGILLGAALSNVLTMTAAESYTTVNTFGTSPILG